MAEETLVGVSLVENLRAAGQRLFERLERDHLVPRSAFWIEDDAPVGWKLVVAYPGVASENPLPFYKRVLDRVPAVGGLYWPSLVRVEDADHPLIQTVRQAVAAEYSKNHVGLATINLHSTQIAPVTVFVYKV